VSRLVIPDDTERVLFQVNPYKKEAYVLFPRTPPSAHVRVRRHFLAINPKGLVPALEYKGQPLNESLVIAEFVEDAFPEPPRLLPTDAFERARIRLWLDHVSKKVLPPYFRLIQAQDAPAQDAAREELYKAQRALAEQVKGPYFAGAQFTLIDAAVAPASARVRGSGAAR
jgi:glutathione S-transferase